MEQTTNAEQPTQRRLTRRRDDRWIGGVASGIADYLSIDAWIVRAAFILLAFAGGSAVLVYILGVLALPTEDAPDEPTPLERFIDELGSRGPRSIGLVILAVLFLGVITANHAFWLPAVLVAVGLVLFRDRWEPALAGYHRAPNTRARVADESGNGAAATASAADVTTSEGAVTTPAYGGARRQRRERVRRDSRLARLTFGIAVLVTGAVVALMQADVLHLKAAQLFAIPLVILGLGILVGTLYGRALRLLLPAFLVGVFATAGAIADVPLHGTTGDRIERPIAIRDVRDTYAFGAGHMVLDFSNLDFSTAVTSPREVSVSQNAGLLEVFTPRNVAVRVEASEGAGVVDVFGVRDTGRSASVIRSSHDGVPQLVLRVRNGFGKISVLESDRTVEQGGTA